MFSKNNTVNLSSILGYYSEVTLKNNSASEAVLFSVGTVLDKTNGNTYPLNSDSTIDFDEGVMVNLLEVDTEWFGSLSIADFDVVEEWFDKEDLDIRGMLLSMDDLVFDNPKGEYEFDMAMNGIDLWGESYK